MENAIINERVNLSNFPIQELNREGKNTFYDTDDTQDIAVGSNLSENLFKPSGEDAGSFLDNLFRGKNTFLNENWQTNSNVQGKILSIQGNEVHVDCLIDFDNNVIQSRCFPIDLFSHLDKIVNELPVIIKTRSKPGTVRIDIYPGEGVVNMDAFTLNEDWDSLNGKKLDSKLTEW